jgi:hypothetical protein
MNRTTGSASGHTADGASPKWWASPYLLLGVALAGNLFVALASHHWPYADATNHLARYTLLDRYWFGPRPPYIQGRLIPGPYMGIDLLGVALVHLFGPVATQKILAAIVVVVLPIGLWLLLDAVGRRYGHEDVRLWALAAVPFGLGWFAETSFMNYMIGVGAVLAWTAFWWPGREGASTARLVVLFFATAVLFLIHLSAPLMALVIVWTDWLFAGAGHRRARLKTVLVATAGVAAVTLWWKVMVPPAPADIHAQFWVTFKGPWVKLRNFLTPFFVFSFPQMVVTLGAYVVAIVLFWRTNRSERKWNTLAWCVGSFFVLYVIFPSNTPGTGYLDARWLMPMYLLPFAAAWHGGRRPSTRVGLALVACALINAATLWTATRRIDHELDDYATVLNGLPPGRRLLPLVADSLRHGLRIAPYRHFAFWYQINRDGRVPSLFNYNGDGGDAPRQNFMSHFTENDQLYTLPPEWGTTVFTPLDWTAIDHDYDYIVVAGRDPRVLQMVEPHARQLTRVGDITVFQPTETPLTTEPSGSPVAEPSRGGAAAHAREGAVP